MAAIKLLIKEDSAKSTYTGHDQLSKEIINTFFKEFLEAFFPNVHDNIDFHAIKPLSEEVYTNVLKGKTRRLDIVIETTLKNTEVVVIVHVEPQSYKQDDFHERMYHYFSMLYNKYQKPIVPIAVFTYKENWEKSQYTMELPFFHVLTFNYMTLHLRKKNWREYIQSDNPAAAALMSQMGYTEEDKVQVKKEFLRMITRMQLDPAKQRIIYGYFETYLKLTKEEEEQLMAEVEKLPEAEKIMEIPISYEEKGKEIGRKEGEEIGVKKVVMEMLKKGLSMDLIAEVTHMDVQEIKELKTQL
ncbi:transposase [Oceanobacillus arenosus]|uniref:Transposase n=1 Tax=Oceanobacillus arenosus TaxID=1229153 RepID=A0A3D8PRE2_9BACI|nr:transposase [Oceanobacillus arenosus]RDW17535.1 transposase [Oceanobacillus arenosus]